MNESLIMRCLDTLCGQPITLLVLSGQVPAEQDDVDDEKAIAADMGSKGDEVAGSVPAKEYLRTWMGRKR